MGLGYVGLPLALMFSEKGFPVVGFDVDESKTATLADGQSYIHEIPKERIQSALTRGFHPTKVVSELKGAHVFIICVPTPLGSNHLPFMDYVTNTADIIAQVMESGALVSLESTVYPNATRTVVSEHLSSGGLLAGKDYFLAHSPERIDPGSGYPLEEVAKLVGGLTAACLELTVELYRSIFREVVPVSSLEVAETAKLHENIFRAVNIALANEMRLICRELGISAWEVIDAAATKPYGFTPFYPGPGIGGHCIPIDPHYLSWRMIQDGVTTRFINLAAEVNEAVPSELAAFIGRKLAEAGKELQGASILVLGVAYKRDIDDMRESPAVDLIEILCKAGAHVSYHDPYIAQIRGLRQTTLELGSVPLTEQVIKKQDVLVIATDHSCLDYGWIVEKAHMVIDPRGVTRRLGLADKKAIIY